MDFHSYNKLTLQILCVNNLNIILIILIMIMIALPILYNFKQLFSNHIYNLILMKHLIMKYLKIIHFIEINRFMGRKYY